MTDEHLEGPGGHRGSDDNSPLIEPYSASVEMPTFFGTSMFSGETEPERRIRERKEEAGEPWVSSVPTYVSRLKTSEDRRNRPEPTWLVDRVLPEYGVGQLYGPTFTGKTYVAIDLALRVANGFGPWCNGDITEPADVVYVLMEGLFDFSKREETWLNAYPGTTGDRLYTLEEEDLDVHDEDSIERLVNDIEWLPIIPKLVIIDTQSLASPGTDEQSNRDMNEIFSNCKKLAKYLNAVILLVHHTGHTNQDRARGASAQFAACDFSISVDKPVIRVKKVKAYKEHGPYFFDITTIGESAYARPATQIEAVSIGADRFIKYEDAITDTLELHPEGMTKGALADAIHGDRNTVWATINTLVGNGTLTERRGARNAKIISLATPPSS